MALVDINGNIIANGGDSHFELVEDIVNCGGVKLSSNPSGWSGDDNWISASNGSVLGNLANGQTEGTAHGFVYRKPFSGTIWVRSICKTTNANINYSSYMIIADDEEAINNPSYETMQSLKNSMNTSIFTIGDVGSQHFLVKTDGTYEQIQTGYIDSSGYENGYGVVNIQKFEIPSGKVGYLTSTYITSNSNYRYIEGINAVFPYDIMNNPTISVVESDGKQLKIVKDNEEGFAKYMAQNSYFKRYFKDVIDSLLPKTTKYQTNGKSLYIGGDSLHQYSGGSGFYISGFVTDYNRHLGFKTVKNDGYAGSTWTGTTGGGAIKRVTDLVTNGTPYDVFILAWGTNPDTVNGTIDDVESNDGSSMVGAMKWCINQLRTTFKYSAIGVIIPPPKLTETTIDEKANLMIEVCELMHVPYVDMRKYISLDDLDTDKVHLGYGANKYGSAEAKLILDICPYGLPLN